MPQLISEVDFLVNTLTKEDQNWSEFTALWLLDHNPLVRNPCRVSAGG